jgi:hypothetical protein
MKSRDPEERHAAEETEAALKEGFAEIKTAGDAARILAKVEEIAGTTKEGDISDIPEGIRPEEPAHAIQAAARDATPGTRPAAVLSETARQVASSPSSVQPSLTPASTRHPGNRAKARSRPRCAEAAAFCDEN